MIGHDRGPSLFRAVVEKFIRQEQEAANAREPSVTSPAVRLAGQ
jgi:hypothetical protein